MKPSNWFTLGSALQTYRQFLDLDADKSGAGTIRGYDTGRKLNDCFVILFSYGMVLCVRVGTEVRRSPGGAFLLSLSFFCHQGRCRRLSLRASGTAGSPLSSSTGSSRREKRFFSSCRCLPRFTAAALLMRCGVSCGA